MGITVHAEEELFDGGPPLGLQKALRLIKSLARRHVSQRAIVAILVSWGPLAILALTAMAFGGTEARSFFPDIGVHARFLIAVPLLILAEKDAIPMFDRVARHFRVSGLVRERDHSKYDRAITTTRQLLEAKTVEITAFVLAYSLVFVLLFNLKHEDTPGWYWAKPGLFLGLSPGGLWHGFVSVPLMVLLWLGWLWRLLLWWRFLGLMALLDLRLVPSHPDQSGGLRFLSASIRGYRLLALAIGTIVASSEMNFLLRNGQPAADLHKTMVVVVIFVVVLATGPLFMFIARLRGSKIRRYVHLWGVGTGCRSAVRAKVARSEEDD